MNIELKQISSLEKIRNLRDMDCPDIGKAVLLPGEHFSYQIAVQNNGERSKLEVSVDSPIAEYVRVYSVKNIPADFPRRPEADDNYIITEPGLIPDLLVPLEEQNMIANFIDEITVFWVEVCLPREIAAGQSSITVCFKGKEVDQIVNDIKHNYEAKITLNVEILGAVLPVQKTIFTQWFYSDCISSAHNVKIYSEEHWELIDKYMKMASDLGINMLLTPVLIPALDTAPGHCRPNTQLVKIEKRAGEYIFDFSLLKKYIDMARVNGIKYFEISHFFSQWGCRFSPNIYIEENGKTSLMFGWHVPANSPSYAEFLHSFIPKLLSFLKEEDILENCYFHISDEPGKIHMENYEYAGNLLKPLLGNCKIMDALSHIEFYEKGLINHPVCTTDEIEPFIEKNVKGLWAYYCCAQFKDVSNRFMAMPSYRNRIIGLQLYKYGIEGFLHWGFNFYYSQHSLYEINPYVTTSTEGIFSSGDAFSVYPGKKGPLASLRAFVFREALEDIEICRMLEKKIGKGSVVELIEKEAGMELTFKQYPHDSEFIVRIIDKIKKML